MDKDGRFLGWLAWAVAVIISSTVVVKTWENVHTKTVRTVSVTGSAKRRITSDLALWGATVTVSQMDATAAYKELQAHIKALKEYLLSQGVKEGELRASSINRTELNELEEFSRGGEKHQKRVFKGYLLAQSMEVQTPDVARAERISREVTQLMERGIPVVSQSPQYLYTRLGEVKIEMLAEASRDARVRAERMVTAAGAALLGKLRKADMGVINVNPANSTETSWGGNNDTTSLDKDIMTIVHVTFDLAE